MKYCPNCQTRYSDDSLKFCLQDGTPLQFEESYAPNPSFSTEEETIVAPKRVQPLSPAAAKTAEMNEGEFGYAAPSSSSAAAAPKSKTLLTVVLTAFIMLVVFGAIGGFAWFYYRGNAREVAVNAAQNTTNQNAAAKKTPTPTATPKPDNGANAGAGNANVGVNAAQPSPTLPPADRERIKSDVADRLSAWENDGKNGDLDSYMQNYAPTVEYYNKGNAGVGDVRQDKQRAFAKYSALNVDISNLTITPDAAGDAATAVFDKEWRFENDETYSAGKVRQQIKMKKINGEWLITGEKDLKLYYKE